MSRFTYDVATNTAVATAAKTLTDLLLLPAQADELDSTLFFAVSDLSDAVEAFRAQPDAGMVDALREYLQITFAPVALLSAAKTLLASQDQHPNVEPAGDQLLVRPGKFYDTGALSIITLTRLAHWAMTGYTLAAGSAADNRAESQAAAAAQDAVVTVLTTSALAFV